jgi:hypothetical protein
MFSIYTTLYNVIKNNIDYKGALDNFCQFADEVVVSIPTKDCADDTLAAIAMDCPKVRIIECPAIRFSDNEFDGKLKNAALQATTQPIKINMDGDERIPLSQKSKWVEVAEGLSASLFQAVFIPSLDLWGSPYTIRKNHGIGMKWRMHKAGLYRGVVRFARLPNGLIDTSKSDTCELIDSVGNLVSTASITPPELLQPENAHLLSDRLFTFHYGYLDFDYRVNINKFWKEKWEDRSGKTESVILSREELEKEPVVQHNLPLE